MRHLVALTYPPDCGLGIAARDNVQAMRDLGWSVDHWQWHQTVPTTETGIVYHHWHPRIDVLGAETYVLNPKQRHIAYWAFETTQAPAVFTEVSHQMSEIWTPSEFCKASFRAAGVTKPIHVVPHLVTGEFREPPNHVRPRRVLTCFDAWSRFARKNPFATIDVFRQAFPHQLDVELVIKCHHLSDEERRSIYARAGADARIRLIEDFLSEEDLLDLFASADVFVSLQRSEGFGLNIAMAQAVGLPVVTTGFGGHLDFCAKHAWLIPYTLVDEGTGDEFYSVGSWADPITRTAVLALRDAIDAGRQREGSADILKRFSRDALKSRIRELL